MPQRHRYGVKLDANDDIQQRWSGTAEPQGFVASKFMPQGAVRIRVRRGDRSIPEGKEFTFSGHTEVYTVTYLNKWDREQRVASFEFEPALVENIDQNEALDFGNSVPSGHVEVTPQEYRKVKNPRRNMTNQLRWHRDPVTKEITKNADVRQRRIRFRNGKPTGAWTQSDRSLMLTTDETEAASIDLEVMDGTVLDTSFTKTVVLKTDNGKFLSIPFVSGVATVDVPITQAGELKFGDSDKFIVSNGLRIIICDVNELRV